MVTAIEQEQPVTLTRRELEILSEIAQGKTSLDVSKTLICSKRTVDFHLGRIFEKLGVNNRVQAFRRATRLGLIDVDLSADKN